MNERERQELERRIYLKRQHIAVIKGEIEELLINLNDYLIAENKRLKFALGETENGTD